MQNTVEDGGILKQKWLQTLEVDPIVDSNIVVLSGLDRVVELDKVSNYKAILIWYSYSH